MLFPLIKLLTNSSFMEKEKADVLKKNTCRYFIFLDIPDPAEKHNNYNPLKN